MKTPRPRELRAILLLLAMGRVLADAPEPEADGPFAPTETPAEQITPPPEASWDFSVAVSTYLTPDDGNFAQPTVTADHDRWHFEARYNYESLRTGSAWVGCNFSIGETVTLEFTPMLGGVFGDVAGVAPGYHGTLEWWKLSLYSEGEYVVDTRDSSESFFYSWSELSISPLEWFRVGMVTQRTRVYATDRDIQRGFLAGLSRGPASLTGYLFNPDDSQPTVVVILAFEF